MKPIFVTGGSGFVGQRLIVRLAERGFVIRALARSDIAANKVRHAGAEAWRGDMSDVPRMSDAMRGCETVFHVAGHLSEWDAYEAFHDSNVIGTQRVLEAAKAAGVPALIAVGAAAVVMEHPAPMQNVREDRPRRKPGWAPYISTKSEAESLVLQANGQGLRTAVVRPPFIWGAGMPMLDEMVKAVRSGQFALPDGGRQAMSTSHVDNVVEGLILAAEKARGGEAYFVADAETATLKDVVAGLLATRGLPPVTRSVPFALAWRMAALLETVWRLFRLRAKPPITRQTLRLIGQDFTLDTAKARHDLGYAPVIARSAGLARMQAENHSADGKVHTGDLAFR